MSSTRHTHAWVSTSLRRMMRRKQRAQRKAKKSVSNGCSQKFSGQPVLHTEGIINDLKENTKRFWSFIKSKRQGSAGVAPLINKEGYLHSDLILNQQFQPVYTKESKDNISDKGLSPFSSIDNVIINPNGVKKLLQDLRPFKSAGPDGIQPVFLELQLKNYLQY